MNTETVPEKKVFENDNAVHNKFVDIFLKIEKSFEYVLYLTIL